MCAVLNHSVISNSVTPWTAARQAPLSMEFCRQEYFRGLPCPPLGDLPNPATELRSSALHADSLPSEPPGKPKDTGMGSLSLLRGSSWPRNWTGISCIAVGSFTSWAPRDGWSTSWSQDCWEKYQQPQMCRWYHLYGLDLLLSHFWTNPLFHVQFYLLLLELYTGFTGDR